MCCYVTYVQYFIFVNRSLGVTFILTRGLRQGDPLSAYMFLLCIEGLSSLMDQAQKRGDLMGLGVTREALKSITSFFLMTVYSLDLLLRMSGSKYKIFSTFM